jgi:hypothetical protein
LRMPRSAGADLRIFDGQCGRCQNGPALNRNGCVTS